MVDTTNTKFHEYVFSWNASDFTQIPTAAGQTFSLKANAVRGETFVDSSNGVPMLNNGANAAHYVIANPTFDSAGNYVPSGTGAATKLFTQQLIDFKAPDGNTYFLARVTGVDSAGAPVDKFISNYTLTTGEAFTTVGIDNTVAFGEYTATYESIWDADINHTARIDMIEAPSGPEFVDEGTFGGRGYMVMATWDNADISVNITDTANQTGILSVSPTAKTGTFVSYDNDGYINDGTNVDYTLPENDLSQIGTYRLADGSIVAEDTIYQAEYGYWLKDPTTGETFQIVNITFGSKAGTDGSMWFTEKPLVPGTNYQMMYHIDQSPGYDNGDVTDQYETAFQYTNLAKCYSAGTMVAAENGQVAVEDIRVGDMLKSVDGEFKPVRWIESRRIEKAELDANPNLRPVVITAGALGNGLPKRDLVVSRQHRIMVRSDLTKLLTGSQEALIPAIKLTQLPGIYVDESAESVHYFHILLDEHDAIYAEGTVAETLYLGEMALSDYSDEAVAELLAIFPDLGKLGFEYPSAFAMPEGKASKEIIAQHMLFDKPLFVNA